MAYLLDTNAVIALMKNHSRVVERIRHVGRFELVNCARSIRCAEGEGLM